MVTQQGAVVRDLRDISKVYKVPTIKKIEVPSRLITAEDLTRGKSALELAADNLRAKQRVRVEAERDFYASIQEFETWMTQLALRQIADINAFVAELGKEYLKEEYVRDSEDQVETTGATEGVVFTIGDRLQELRTPIDEYLSCGDPRISLPLKATEVAFWLSIKPLTRRELRECVRKLVGDNVLYESPNNGDIEVFGARYVVERRFDELVDPHRTRVKTKIKDAILAQVNRLKEEYDQELKAKAVKFFSPENCTMQAVDLADETKTGKCGAFVPGGIIWVEANEREFALLDVAGVPANGFAQLEAVEATYPNCKIRVNRKTVCRNGKVAGEESPRFGVPMEITKDDAEQYIGACKFAWHVIRDATETALTRRRQAVDGLNAREFHNGALGKYRPCVEGFTFTLKNQKTKETLSQTAMDATAIEEERFQNPGEDFTRIRVASHNPDFHDFLLEQKCLDSDGYHEGDTYDGLPFLLQLINKYDFRVRIKGEKPGPRDRVEEDESEINLDHELSTEEFRNPSRVGWHEIYMEKWTHKFPCDKSETVHKLRVKVRRSKGGRIQVIDFSPEHKDFLDRAGLLEPEPFPPDSLPTILWNIIRVHVASASAGNNNGNGTKTKAV